jgi:tRNA-dihydrouridine synthase A
MTLRGAKLPARRISVAPMMKRTDRHFRFLMRLITRESWLYTEMVVARALLHENAGRLLAHDAAERPLGLQVGGSDPATLARAARLAEAEGFDEINLNAGCPSARVTGGRMGACLMREPARVGECVAAMRSAAKILVTVKTRIGVDHEDDFDFLCRFVETIAGAGCRTVIVHARKAWLNGLSPKANRSIPQLDYERVFALKRHFPALEIIVNGGVDDLDAAVPMFARCDGVMFGRAAYARPLMFTEADRRFYAAGRPAPALEEILAAYLDYLSGHSVAGKVPPVALGHLAGLFAGLSGARRVRRKIGELAGTRSLAALERELAPWLRSRAA